MKNLTKLIIISNTSWNIFNFRMSLMRHLKDNGYEVIVLAPFDEYSCHIEAAGFKYINLPMSNKGINPFQDIILIYRLNRILIKENVKIILSYTHKPNIYSSIVGGLRGIRVLPNISGLGAPFISQNIVTKVIKLLYKFSLKYSFKVFFQNFEDLDLFVSLGLIHKDKAERIPGSGVNVKYFSQEKSKSKKTGTFIFLMMSRILWDKGVGEYIKAARLIKIKYPNVRFQLLGFLDVENPKAISRSKVNDWVEEGVVDYIGKTNDVKKFIQEVDCVVLPSYREGLPRSLLEAASLEIPIIATDVPGCRDVVENEVTGFLCDVKNPDHLAKKMELMIDLTSLERSKMGTYGREKIIKEFDEEIVIKAYLNALLIE